MKGLKTILGIALATTGFGGVAAVSATSFANADRSLEVVEATTENVSGTRIYIEDQTGKGWTNNGVDPVAHMWSLTFVEGSGYSTVSDIPANAFGSSLSKNTTDGTVDATLTWTSGSHRQYYVVVPWYIASFSVCFYATENSNSRYVYEKGGANSYQFAATRGNEYKLYFYNDSGYGPWWDGLKFRTNISKVDTASYTYAEDKYSITVNAGANGSVSPSSTSYFKNAYITLTATPNSYYNFVSWSDGGAATHKVYVTANATYTATFGGSVSNLVQKLNDYSNTSGTCGNAERFPACRSYLLALSSSEQNTFKGYGTSGNSTQKAAYNRYVDWAAALGQDPWSNASVNPSKLNVKADSSMDYIYVILVVSIISSASLVGYFLLRKKKEN